MFTHLLGVDPGLAGAIVVFDTPTRCVLEAHNIPTLETKRNGKLKKQVDICVTIALLRKITIDFVGISACMELVGAMPKQGVSSVFSFGRTDGIIETAIVAASIPLRKVAPQVWKRALSVGADKDCSLLRASQLMPASVEHWTPKRLIRDKQDCIGIADAALIAYFAGLTFK